MFGSHAKSDYIAMSDIDFLVRFSVVNPFDYFDNFMNFKSDLEQLFAREVDLIEVQTVKKPVLKEASDRDKRIIYGQEDSKVAVWYLVGNRRDWKLFCCYLKEFNQYSKNLILKRAVERDLEIISEAIKRILNQYPDFPLVNAIKIIGLRKQIIHAYDNISDENIWAIIRKHIPKLKDEIKKHIQM